MASACSTNSAVKTHTLGAGQFVEFIFSNRERNEIWNEYEQNRTEVFLFAESKFCGKVVLFCQPTWLPCRRMTTVSVASEKTEVDVTDSKLMYR